MWLLVGIAAAFSYLVVAVVLIRQKRGPEQPAEDDKRTPILKPANRRQGIYVGPEATPFRVTNERASVHLRIFSCEAVELIHTKVNIRRGNDYGFTMESAEPMLISETNVTDKSIEKELTPQEVVRIQDANIVAISGTAHFKDCSPVEFKWIVDLAPFQVSRVD